jgi:hypothetical protein
VEEVRWIGTDKSGLWSNEQTASKAAIALSFMDFLLSRQSGSRFVQAVQYTGDQLFLFF